MTQFVRPGEKPQRGHYGRFVYQRPKRWWQFWRRGSAWYRPEKGERS